MKVKNNIYLKGIYCIVFLIIVLVFIPKTIYHFIELQSTYNAALILMVIVIAAALAATLQRLKFTFKWPILKWGNWLLIRTEKIEIQWYYILLLTVGLLLVCLKIPTDYDMLVILIGLFGYFLDVQEPDDEPLEIEGLFDDKK